MKVRALFAAVCALLMVAACATQKEEEKVEATSEIIYEDAPNTPVPTSPFANCQGQMQQGATILKCGNTVAVYIPVPAQMSEQQIEQNFQQFQASFPPESTRERFTQQIGEYQATGMRVFEESQASPFRAEMLVIPTGPSETKVLSCAISGSTDYTRCSKIVTELVTSGVPADIEGLPAQPPATATDAGADAAATDADGGMAAEPMGAPDAGTGTTTP